MELRLLDYYLIINISICNILVMFCWLCTEETHISLSIFFQRPADIIHRKKPSAFWFSFTTIERLWCQLEQMISLGNMVNQCEKLKKLLHEALLRHLNLVCPPTSISLCAPFFFLNFTLLLLLYEKFLPFLSIIFSQRSTRMMHYLLLLFNKKV